MSPARTVCLAAALALSFTARANPYEFRLSNGLRLIVKEDHRAPTVVQQVWYRAGSMDESPGVTGVAHVLEHMMFKGTRRLGPGEFSRLIAEAGGRENAFTNTDYTVYHEQVHRDRLPLAMRLEADRMADLVVRADQFRQEIKVVMEERRLNYEDRPRSLLEENLMATAFAAHPYKWPVIGWMQDLENMTWRDALAWYRRWYAPNNAVVVIVGDVEPKQVLAWARRYYGGLEAGVREVLARVASEGVSAEELARGKTARVAQQVYRRDSMFAQALEIGELESGGLSFRDADRILEKLKAVTAEQIRAVAAKYLVEDVLTAAVLDPQPLGTRAPPAATGH